MFCFYFCSSQCSLLLGYEHPKSGIMSLHDGQVNHCHQFKKILQKMVTALSNGPERKLSRKKVLFPTVKD